MFKPETDLTPQAASKAAVKWNGIMSAAQFVAAGAFGNIGFATEALHNAADSFSFEAKRRALTSNRKKALRLRKAAVGVLFVGGGLGLVGGAKQALNGESEDSSKEAVAVAVGGAVLNTYIAKKTHKAEHDHHSHNDACASGAHEDSKLHALTDAGTGCLYSAGLIAEAKYPGAANIAVMVNGGISLTAAGLTGKNISRDKAT